MRSSDVPVAPPPADPEAPRWLSDEEQRAWIAVARLVLQLPGALDAQLQRDAGINLFEYLALSRLSMAPGRTLRMGELAETDGRVAVPPVERRQASRAPGLVRREAEPDDGRYTKAILTQAGWSTVVAAAPGHVDAVRHLVLDPLEASQITALSEIGEQLRTHVRSECDAAAHGSGEGLAGAPDDLSGCDAS
ncbi:MarR family transcriptional regulator [Janibacter melonis]|uniref:MarR family winged helix-turn-helix transcriptional regulator n=1 Tax=Janibacter melonis TaxID=262209 RepID=UPI00177D42B3